MLNKRYFFEFISKFFLLSILLILVLGFLAANINAVSALTAEITSFFLNFLGMESAVSSTLISLPLLEIEIVPLCTGYISASLLLGFMIVFPTSIKKKLSGILIFVPLAYLGTITRLVTSFYVGNIYGPDSFFLTHDFFWQFGMMGLVILFLVVWLHFFVKKEEIMDSFKNQ